MFEPDFSPPTGNTTPADSELARATRIYETILATTDDFAYIFDPQGRFLYANRPLLKLYGKPLDQVVGKSFHQLGYPPWHAEMHMHEIQKIVRDKVQIQGEVPFTGESGISGVFDYIFKPVLDTDGNVEVIVGTTRDVTARKKDEQKLERALKAKSESEQRYRFLADSVPQIVWTAQPDGDLDYYNQRWFDYAGTTWEESRLAGWASFVHADDLPRIGQVWQHCVETGTDYEIEFRIRRASDATYRWHLVRAFPMRAEDGEILQWVGTCTDIDDQRQLSEKLGEIAAKFRSLFDQSSVFAGIMTPAGILIEANSLSTDGCGFTAAEVLGKPFWDCGWWRGSKKVQEKIRLGTQQAVEGTSYTETLPYLLGDGTVRVVDLAIHPIRNDQGKVIFLNPTGVDVTSRHRSLAQTEFLSQLTQKLSLVSDSSEINRIASREIGQFLGVHRCYFFQAIRTTERVQVWPDWCREASSSLEGIYTLADFGPPEWWQDVQRGSVQVHDIRSHPQLRDFLSNYLKLGIAAYSLSPFVHEGHWRASISVTSDKPRIWTPDETALLENAVARVWPLIERARLEGVLRENEMALSHIAAVVESSDDAIISKTLEGIITSWNAGAERIFGYTAQETIGQSIFLLIPAELQKEEPGILAKLRRGERIEHYETVRVAKDGRQIDISLSVSPIKDSTGKVIGASKIARDITEDKRRQEALRESEVRFRSMADAAPILIWEAGTDQLRNYVNQTWLNFVGRSLEQETGKGWLEGVHPEDRTQCLNIYLTSFEARQPFEMEYRIRHHTGEYRWLFDQGSPRFGPQGTFQGYIGACVDITESVQARETMEERKAELERLVGERTASLQEAVAQMEEFSYSVSHDLRAPLRAMQGYATAVLEDYGEKLDDEGRNYLQRIVSAGTRMDRLTRDVLVYSKIPRTAMKLHPVGLDKLVIDIVQQYLQVKNGTAEISIETPLLPVVGNESFLAQAISNLVDNAVKFTTPGEAPRVRIWTEACQNDVRLWVEDNGIGIQPEHQGRIWGMFERVHPQNVYDGTGIGLAIVRKTIERMNGTMGVESDGKSGSKFWILLPGIDLILTR